MSSSSFEVILNFSWLKPYRVTILKWDTEKLATNGKFTFFLIRKVKSKIKVKLSKTIFSLRVYIDKVSCCSKKIVDFSFVANFAEYSILVWPLCMDHFGNTLRITKYPASYIWCSCSKMIATVGVGFCGLDNYMYTQQLGCDPGGLSKQPLCS